MMLLVLVLLGWSLSVSGDPVVTIELPKDNPTGEVVIGEEFTFIVKFWNDAANPPAVGYGPFVDLYLEYKGADCNALLPNSSQAGSCDGIEFVEAHAKFSSPEEYLLAPPPDPEGVISPLITSPCGPGITCPNSSATAINSHPFGVSFPSPPCYVEGFQLIVLELPPQQMANYNANTGQGEMPIEIEVTAKVHKYADHDEPLMIYARGGFRYGGSPGGLPDVQAPPVALEITPLAFKVTKKFVGPHDDVATNCPCKHKVAETVPGPHHIGTYTIVVDVATDHSIENLQLWDYLPDELQYVGSSLSIPLSMTPVQELDPTQPGGTLVLECANLVGAAGADLKVTFDAYATDLPDCEPIETTNKIVVEADWQPMDPRDLSDCPPNGWCNVSAEAEHKLLVKCLVLRKSVALIPGATTPGCDSFAGTTPGDRLRYTIEFAISDYARFDEIEVTDILSDGQKFDRSTATLEIQDPVFGGPHTIPLSNFTDVDEAPFVHKCPTSTGTQLVFAGTRVYFHISEALEAHFVTSIMSGDPHPGALAATGTITFEVDVLDEYADDDYFELPGVEYSCGYVNFLPLDPEVDKLDPLLNCAKIEAVRIDPAPAIHVEDGGFTCQGIPNPPLFKSVYKVYRNLTGETIYDNPDETIWQGAEAATGDWVTFRIYKVIPSCDAEEVVITDWLPSGVFDVAAYTWQYQTGLQPGTWKLGPDHNAPQPNSNLTVAVSQQENSLTFDCETFTDDDTGPSCPNEPCTIDILFTIAVEDQAIADKTIVRNVAQECESSTISGGVCQMAIAELKLREPELRITKGVVSVVPEEGTSVPGYGAFSPAPPAPVDFNDPCSCELPSEPAFDNSNQNYVTSTYGIDSDLSDVDHDDIVRFAIVVENIGGASAFDVTIEDDLAKGCYEIPDCCYSPNDPNNDYNVKVTDGAGEEIHFTGDLFSGGITLVDPGPTDPDKGALDAKDANSPGRNVAVITYEAMLPHSMDIGNCCTNTATLTRYAAIHSGHNFVDENLGGPFEDDATVCIKPAIDKCIICTSEAHTTPQSTDADYTSVSAAIGEIVRYRLLITLPETNYPHLIIEDFLGDRMRYLEDTAKYSFVYTHFGAVTIASSSVLPVNGPWNPAVDGCLIAADPIMFNTLDSSCVDYDFISGGQLAFDFWEVTNSDNDWDKEYLIVEFNAIVVNDSTSLGDFVNNCCYVYVFNANANGQLIASLLSDTVGVLVVGPELEITKEITFVDTDGDGCPSDDEVQIKIWVTNVGTAAAYDVKVIGEATGTSCALNGHTWNCPFHGLVPGGVSTWHPTAPWKIELDGACCDCDVKIVAKYSSLPGGFGTDPNCTGSVVTDPPGTLLGEWVSTSNAMSDCTWTFPLCGKIEGTKWHDKNCDGPPFSVNTDPPLDGWTITATETTTGYQCSDVTGNAGIPGEYSICVPPGEYEVTEELQPGWCMSYPTTPHVFTVEAGETVDNIDFANCRCCRNVANVTVSWEDPSGTSASDTIVLYNGVTATLPTTITLGPTPEITVDAPLSCDPGSSQPVPPCTCDLEVEWSVSDLTGAPLLATGVTLPATFALPDACPGQYRIVVSSYCDAELCSTYTLNLDVECGCAGWDSFHVSWPYHPTVTLNCGYAVPVPIVLGFADEITVDYAPSCSGDPACCPPAYTWTLYDDIGTLVPGLVNQSSLPATFSYPGTGTYRLVFNGSCGSSACSTCWIDMEIAFGECACKGGEVVVSWPGTPPFVIPCAPNGQCEDVGLILIDCTDSIQIDLDGAHCQGPGVCDQAYPYVTWTAYSLPGNVWVADGSGTPASFNPPASGKYLVVLDVSCPSNPCPPRQLILDVEEQKCECRCMEWMATVQIADANTGAGGTSWQESFKCGDYIDLPPGIEAVAVTADFDCDPMPPGCVSIYQWVVTHAGTLDVWAEGTCYTDPCSFTFDVPFGAFDVTILPTCGFEECEPCAFTIDTGTKSSCGAWTDFDGDGVPDLSVEGRLVDCDGEIVLSSKDITGPVTIDPSYQSSPDFAGHVLYAWEIYGPEGYHQSSGDNPVRGPIEFKPRLAGTYMATITPRCGDDVCQACRVLIVLEEEAPTCECSRWGEIDVNGQVITCNGQVILTTGSLVTIEPDYRCVGEDCETAFIWDVHGPSGFQSLNNDEPIRFMPETTGTYMVKLTPTCNGGECPSCQFLIVMKEPEPTCECGRWGEIDAPLAAP
jgi:hypothetical protein